METDIELLARAPFSFWASTRRETPISIDGEAVMQIEDLDKPLFSDRFIYFITRQVIQANNSDGGDTLLRHGGCPALHWGPENGDIIRTTGETYLRFYEALSSAAEVASQSVRTTGYDAQ
jgi:hypothetical protein